MDKITKITIGNQEYTVEEARQIYEELRSLFGAAPVYIPQPYYVPQPWNPIITYDTSAVPCED